MKKTITFISFLLLCTACYRLPQREEIEYRNKLENALVDTFPKKVTVVLHPFENLSKKDTNRAYLESAIPDSLEALLEPLRSTLAYIPFEGMPFYVSDELSNLFQSATSFTNQTDTNTNTTNYFDELVTNENNSLDTIENNYNEAYFTYLTNYLLVIPTQETQYTANTTTNTNFFTYVTNTKYESGVEVTNITTNETLITRTNSIDTNVIIVNKNLLTPTNMLLLLYEEFPELTNYLSFLPIQIRRATDTDKSDFTDFKLRLENPVAWRAAQNKKKNTESEETPKSKIQKSDTSPSEPFEYIYHITGNYSSSKNASFTTAAEIRMQLQIYPPFSTGELWWEKTHSNKPPKLSDILKLEESLDPNDIESFKQFSLRTPFTKPPISPRLQDEFNTYSTNFRDTRPETPDKSINTRNRPLTLTLKVRENEIPTAMVDWLKHFHATIINRPYTVLKLTSSPPDALIYLNGFFIGSTPLVYPTAPIGKQRITFLKDGFNREEILTEIIPEQTNSIFYELQTLNNSGTINITASIPDAEIYINSQYKGKAPMIVSNLSLYTKYRVEILDPSANLSSNRNSVYQQITLTEKKSSVVFDAQFKNYETTYRTSRQKALLAATYISWFSTIALMGASIYTQARANEAEDLISQIGTPITDNQKDALQRYTNDRNRFAIASQATLYSTIAAAILSSGIMGWYLYSKEVYLGLDVNPEKKEWYANFKLKF